MINPQLLIFQAFYMFTSVAEIMDDKPTTNFAFSHGLVMAGVRYWCSMLSIYRASRVGYF